MSPNKSKTLQDLAARKEPPAQRNIRQRTTIRRIVRPRKGLPYLILWNASSTIRKTHTHTESQNHSTDYE